MVWTDNRQNNNTYTVYYRKVTLGGGGGGPPQADLVKDNKDATGIQLTGAWVSSTVTPGYYHSNYIHDNNTAKGTKSVRFTPTLSSAGNYEVFARWTSGENRASNVPMDIVHAGGTATVSVNQKINGQQWFSLGTYAFDAGANGSVLIRTAGTSGYVMADAVKFVPAVPEVIMDNGDPGIVVTGSWTVSTATVGYFGNNYLQDGNTGKGTKSVRYAPALFAADYEVFARWTAGSNRPANVPIDVVHLDGTDTVAVNQQANNGQWMSLGTYSFAAGTDGSVLVRTDGTSGSVIADAVKFSPPNGGGSAGGPLPSPWIQADVGTVGLAGEATYAAGTFSVQGTGTHLLSTTTDSFCYVYQAASGDCSITARIASHENNPTLGRYGVMIRESLAANATSAVLMMHSTGLSYKYRKSPGGSLGTVSGGAGSTPYWVRVARSGNTFTASKSTDGVNWASIGSATIVMGTDVHIGLVECSSNNAQPGTANFDNVTALP